MNQNIVKKIRTTPQSAGIYIFYKNRSPLYVGKASNLKNRLQSYLKITDLKNRQLSQEANRLKLITLSSPIEALIQEARLIKELKPTLNIYWRDDKNHFYVAFTKEKFPKVFVTHQIKNPNNDYLGPFTDGGALRLVLKILRRHFPYCTCFQDHLRDCLNAQIGLCSGYCCSAANKLLHQKINCNDSVVNYEKNIRLIKRILSGKNKNILKKLIRPEDNWAAENILEHSQFLDQSTVLKKIECYDISNFAGKEAVGAFTVLVNQNGQWLPDKNQFRKFKIKYTSNTRNDPAMIAEILQRRLNHPEWPYPDLIIIDGGITQYNAARRIVKNIPVISFAKPNKKIYGQNILLTDGRQIVEKAIKQTHQYIIGYHRQTRDRIRL